MELLKISSINSTGVDDLGWDEIISFQGFTGCHKKCQSNSESVYEYGQNLNSTNIQIKVVNHQSTNISHAVRNNINTRQLQGGGIAFSVYLDHDLDLGAPEVLKYNKIITNEGGGYNLNTGAFICPESGMYLLSFYIGERGGLSPQGAYIYLKVNNVNIIDAVVDAPHYTQDLQGGNTVIIRLKAGDVVITQHEDSGGHVEAKVLNLSTTANYINDLSRQSSLHYNSSFPENSWSITSQKPSKSNISTLSINISIRRGREIKHNKLVLTYLCSLLLVNSYAPEPNPGPTKYPCGSCSKAVTWRQKAVCCDTCDEWYHIKCEGIDQHMYKILNNSNISWECIKCGMPNFSTTFFNTTIETSNSYADLSTDDNTCNLDHIGTPTHTSSPILKQKSKPFKQNKKQSTVPPLRVLTINFQSIKNKKPEIDEIIDSCQPDVIFGTETWLSNDTSAYEYISPSKYTIYTKNRKDGYGGVLLAITNTLITSHVPELDTDCELIWAKITPTGNKTTYLGAYYRPPSDKGESLEHLSTSLNRICNISSANIMLSGDFNLGNIDWSNSSVIPSKPDPSLHQHLLDILQDHNLTQVVDKPTRNDRTLDLLCMSNPSLVNRVETLPPLGDHDIIFSEINLSLSKAKQSPHKVFIYKKADWEKIGKDLKETYTHMEKHKLELDIDNMWNFFKTKTTESIQKHIPTKLIADQHLVLPWYLNHSEGKLP
ncbi:unnamed protein product [Mytilus coruscus]|uniref:PHD-type domain-containing protein n=1 Tax=Mytilus coruscus TaxID=42192 RepID=A0A6J8B836_MYTCO|nr:unnamed protein product [Mytilus coruscus]